MVRQVYAVAGRWDTGRLHWEAGRSSCSQLRQTKPISGVFGLETRVAEKANPIYEAAQRGNPAVGEKEGLAMGLNLGYIWDQKEPWYMKLSERIAPISYLKAHAAQIIRDLCTRRGTMVITQNGQAKAVVQDIETYEQTQESLALLKLLAQGQHDVEAGRTKPVEKAFADLAARTKDLP